MQWLRRIRGAIGMGVTWAVGWACFGLIIGVSSRLFPGLPWWDRFFSVFDAPLPMLAVPGFFAGACFSLVLGIAARRRRFAQLSLRGVAAWGAVGGALLSLVPAALTTLGLASIGTSTTGLWQLTAMIAGPLVVLSSASASGSLILARRAEERTALSSGVNAPIPSPRSRRLPSDA